MVKLILYAVLVIWLMVMLTQRRLLLCALPLKELLCTRKDVQNLMTFD
jgi:hypothetical protein